MSKANVEIVRRFVDAFKRRDDQATVHPRPTPPARRPDEGLGLGGEKPNFMVVGAGSKAEYRVGVSVTE
jgi:hypothetical protein